MKMLLSLDFFLWTHFVPRISAEFFKNKINSLLAMAYISIYRLPRKFLTNYFQGNGKIMVVDTKELIECNFLVLNMLIKELQASLIKNQANGSLVISQTDVSDPNYRYSVGSFIMNYKRIDERVTINIESKYRFRESPDRITKHLHHWLFTLKNKGKASDFAIEGNNWTIDMNELNSFENQQKSMSYLQGKLLV